MSSPRRLTREQIERAVEIDPVLGTVKWKHQHHRTPWQNARDAGKTAGGKNSKGYFRVTIDGITVLRHRLVWFWVHGTWPQFLDHINGLEAGDGIANLRQADRAQNARNARRRKDNTSGIKGVSRCPHRPDRWVAQIQVAGRPVYLGRHSSKEAAAAAYRQAALHHFGDFARLE